MKGFKKTFRGVLAAMTLGLSAPSMTLADEALGWPEKADLKFGFIKLTDMAPLAIAYEKGYFEEEGLFVTLEAQANWKVLLDRVIDGQLDGAHMLAGQAIATAAGIGGKVPLIAPLSFDLNGNAITVSNKVWSQIEPKLPKGADGKVIHPVGQPITRTGAGFVPLNIHLARLANWRRL